MSRFLVYHIHSWEKDKPNIAHFFHEIVFHAIAAYLKDNTVIFVLDTALSEWESKLMHLFIKHLNIAHEYDTLYYDKNIPCLERNIQRLPRFTEIMALIRATVCNEFPDIIYTGNYKVLYLRDECLRRKMLGYNGELNQYFHEVITDMSALTFEQQVKLFMKCSHFITIEGAQLTNIIFMNKDATIYSLSTTNNCWTYMFGTYTCIKKLELIVLNYPNFNDNIRYTPLIQNTIMKAIGAVR